MKVSNIHQCEIALDLEKAGVLIDSLATSRDLLWPNHIWPKMELDKGHAIGSTGGHGPIRYFVEEHIPGKSIRFRFSAPKGFDGYHSYDIIEEEKMILRHSVIMKTRGLAVFSWPLIFGPMHNALIEDSLTKAQISLGVPGEMKPWSIWVKILRWLISGGKARSQVLPNKAKVSG